MNNDHFVRKKLHEFGAALHACIKNGERKEHLNRLHRLSRTLRESARLSDSAQLRMHAEQAAALVDTFISHGSYTEPEVARVISQVQALLHDLPPEVTKTSLQPSTVQESMNEPEFKTVYLVNDNPLLAKDTALQLQCFGYQIFIANNFRELATLMQERQPSCIIIDQSHRESYSIGSSDIESIRSLTAQHLPILLLSTRSNFEARLSAVRAGVDGYFIKPVDIVSLIDRIDALALRKDIHPYRVLIISSDNGRSADYENIVRQVGMDVLCLHKPIDLFRTLNQYRPELVVMDVHTQSCTGDDLTALIRQDKAHLDVPIIVLSDDSDPKARRHALSAGADDFLLRHMSPEDFIFSISSRMERSRALRGLIMRDGLTGLYNHTAIKEHLVRDIGRSKRDGTPLALAMVDIDFFKKINDTYGHPVGDQVIRAISRLLQQRLRRGDLIGRYGGEEFAVILPATTAANAFCVLDEIRESFQKIRHKADDKEFFSTFSAGVAELDAGGLIDAGALFRIADTALYHAKQTGRNCVKVAEGQ